MYTRSNLDKFFTLNLSDLRLKQGKFLLIIRPGELDEIRKKDIDVEVIKVIHDPSANEIIKLAEITGRGR